MAYAYRHGDRPLERVTIQRAVGRGGFGEVYYATTDAGKEIALKVLRDNADVELRGIREVMNLNSPHLVQIYDVQQAPTGEWFVLMEYVRGPALNEVLRIERDLSPGQAVYFARGIAQGLSVLHQRGIVHRDLKPANIFHDEGYVKIGDYGLSKNVGTRHSGQTVSVGTVHYMAPEIATGSYTQQVDLYALGVVLYEMLAGRLPFVGESMQEVLVRQARDAPDATCLPMSLRPIVLRLLAKAPQDRYSSADELLDALAEAVAQDPSLAGFNPSTLERISTYRSVSPTAVTEVRPPDVLDVRDVDAAQPYAMRPPYEDRVAAPHADAFMGPLVGFIIFASLGASISMVSAVIPLGPLLKFQALLFVTGAVFGLVLLYRWWATLPPGWRRTTPARAVGFLFIPLFNLYWFFVAFHGLVTDLNRYRQVVAPRARRISHRLLVVCWILFALSNSAWDDNDGGFSGFILTGLAVTAWITFMTMMTNLCQVLVRRRTRIADGVQRPLPAT